MSGIDNQKLQRRIRYLTRKERILFTQHANIEMINDNFSNEDVIRALVDGEIIENYPDHKRGPCCLINGPALDERPVHVVCGTGYPELVIITVYEPKPPKWISPVKRRHTK